MWIEAITLRKLRMRLKAPFEASVGTTHDRTILLIELLADGITGWSEVTALEAPVFTSETWVTASAVIRHFLVPLVLGKQIEAPSDVPEILSVVRGHEMAKAGIENAIWHVESQQKNMQLWKLLGGTQTEIPCGVSIGLHAWPEVLVDKVTAELAAGYQRIKVKIKPGCDLQYIRAVRNAHPNIMLSVDANAAYTPADTEHLKRFDEFNLLMIEQPLWWDDIVQHAKLQKQLKTRICLDEPIHSARDAQSAIELDAARVINIKLGRVAGHTGASQVQACCLAHHVPAWCGGMFETGIGRAHNIAAASLPGYTLPGDISASKRYWDEDLVDPPVEVTPQGTIRVPTSPGLGYHVRQDLVERCTIEKETWRAR